MMWQTYPLIKIFIGIAILCLIFIYAHSRTLKTLIAKNPSVQKNKINALFYISTIFILSGFTFGRLGQYPLRWSDAFTFTDAFKANTALNPFQSFVSSLQFRNSKYDINKVKKAYPLMSDYFKIKNPDSINLNFTRTFNFEDSKVKPNVVLVICESFSAYKSSMFGNKLNPTPYFNQMCNEGVFFE